MAERLHDPNLEVGSLFSRSWAIFKDHMWPTIAVFLIYSLVTSSGNWFDGDGGFGELIIFIITGPIAVGTYMYAVQLVRGHDPDIGEMFNGFREFGRAVGVFVLYTVITVVGLVFLIVPGVFLAVAFFPAIFLVLDDSLGVMDSLRKAWTMTEGNRGRIFLVLLALLGLNILGLIALIIGVIFTGALSLVICAMVYDELARAYDMNLEFETAL